MKLRRTFSVVFAICLSIPSLAWAEDDLVAGLQDLCWSPDGKFLYFSGMWRKPDYSDYSPAKWKVYRYELENDTTVHIADSAYNVAVSPDGKKLAVAKLVGEKMDIFIMDADGKNPIRLTGDPADEFSPSWSPEGNQIVFNSRKDGNPEIYVIDTDGQNQKRITFSNPHSSYNPVWAPSGRYIVYYLEKGDGQDQIFIMYPDGTGARNLTNDSANNYFPGWYGPGSIIYTQDQSEGKPSRIYTVNLEGKNKKPVMEVESFFGRYSIQPGRGFNPVKSRKLAYIDREGHCIRIVSDYGESTKEVSLPKGK